MRIIRCDRCGKDIENGSKIFYISVQNRKWSDGELCGENPYEDWDICETCANAITWMIDGADDAEQDPVEEESETVEEAVEAVEEAVEEEPEEAPQEPEEPPEEEKPKKEAEGRPEGAERARKGRQDRQGDC